MSTSYDGWNVPSTRRGLLRKAGGAFGATVAGSSLLAACGGGSGGDSGGHAKVEFWDMLWGLDKYEKTARGLVAEYNKANPNVTVTYRLIPWTSFYEVFSTAVASGTTPDVSTGATYQAFQFDKAIAPVNNVIDRWKKDGTLAGINPASVQAQVDGSGKQTGLPWCQDSRVLSYNKKLFDKAGVKPPTNFEELRAAAKELTGGGVYGIGFCGQTALSAQQLISLMLNNGGGLYSTDCGPSIVNDRNAEVCELIQNMVRDGSIPKAAIGWDNTDISNAMGRGAIAMTIGEPGLFSALPNGDDIDVTSPLTGPHGDKGTILWETAMWLYESAKNKQAATDFMTWWLGNEQPLWTDGGTTQLPVRKSFYTQIKSFEDPRYQKVIDEWMPVGKILSAPCDHALPTLNQVEGQAFLPTLAQNILSLKPIDASLKTAQDALGKLKAA